MESRIKLEALKQFPELGSAWTQAQVHIWSGEHGAWWRTGAHGYTADRSEAGRWTFCEAFTISCHAGPEKRIEYVNANRCFVHPKRPAVKKANIPCAPSGGLWLCEECCLPGSAKRVFDAYRKAHSKRIKAFKQENVLS